MKLDARYAPPKRRRSAWGEGFEEDLEQARRVAAAIVQGVTTERLPNIPRPTGATSQHAQEPVEAWHRALNTGGATTSYIIEYCRPRCQVYLSQAAE